MGAKAAPKPKKTTKKPPSQKKKCEAVQKWANLYARRRDCFGQLGTNCISCGKWKIFEELDGGHFIPTTSSDTRFDERNINAQCHRCNRFLHSNPRGYIKGMLQKYGADVVNGLEAREKLTKTWSDDELAAIRTYFRQKLKDLDDGIPPEYSQPLSASALWADVPLADSVSLMSMLSTTLEGNNS